MDYRAEYKRQNDIIANIIAQYKKMLEDDDLDEKSFAAITIAIYKIEKFKDPFVSGLTGVEFGGTPEAVINGWDIPKNHLPLREDLGKSLLARALARDRAKIKP